MSNDIAKALLARAEGLTSIVRTAWISLILGCLYAWLTLAALPDIDLFLPEKTLTLPIVGSGISADGFFLFAPILLLALFLYFQLMLARLWECYGRLRQEAGKDESCLDGLTVDEYVPPWFLTVLIPHPHRGFDYIAKSIAFTFCWGFAPITILALGYRYLPAHEYALTLVHCLVAGFSIVAVIRFLRHHAQVLADKPSVINNDLTLMLLMFAPVSLALWIGAYLLINNQLPFLQGIRFLSPHAQLIRAELSRRPPGWDELQWRHINKRIEELQACGAAWADDGCPAPNPQSSSDTSRFDTPSQELESLLEERGWYRETIIGAQLGRIPTSDAPKPQAANTAPNICETKEDLVSSPRDLRFAVLLEAYLVNASLHCADLYGADLRRAQLEGADLRSAVLEEADFTQARLQEAVLTDAKMQGAKLPHAQAQGADFTRAKMRDANFEAAQLQRSVFNGAEMSKAKFINAKITGADLSAARMEGVNLTGAQMQDAGLTGAQMQDADLSSAQMQGTVLEKTQMQRATLLWTNLEGALLLETSLEGADLQWALLPGAVLWKTTFDRATDFSNAKLAGALLRSTDLSEANIARGQIESAFGDASVKLPEGVSLPSHWSDAEMDDISLYRLWQGWRMACGWPAVPPG